MKVFLCMKTLYVQTKRADEQKYAQKLRPKNTLSAQTLVGTNFRVFHVFWPFSAKVHSTKSFLKSRIRESLFPRNIVCGLRESFIPLKFQNKAV